MRLASKIAVVHAVLVIILAIATWPVPLDGFAWLRAADFVVFWRVQDMAGPAIFIVQLFTSNPILTQVAIVGTCLYVVSFLLAGTLQWFLLGLGIAKIKQAVLKGRDDS